MFTFPGAFVEYRSYYYFGASNPWVRDFCFLDARKSDTADWQALFLPRRTYTSLCMGFQTGQYILAKPDLLLLRRIKSIGLPEKARINCVRVVAFWEYSKSINWLLVN